jgi:hypothetical protein
MSVWLIDIDYVFSPIKIFIENFTFVSEKT